MGKKLMKEPRLTPPEFDYDIVEDIDSLIKRCPQAVKTLPPVVAALIKHANLVLQRSRTFLVDQNYEFLTEVLSEDIELTFVVLRSALAFLGEETQEVVTEYIGGLMEIQTEFEDGRHDLCKTKKSSG